ncbi:phage shock envelope stress response protein PspM [Mycobacterium sp. WMMD1722]|uniref:phage shock envelope stress response protein PspM n=1 Tax=Mycobacterium sp. WMMD1722 TaxID=3404117 RepID=UPI003BF495D9
MKVQTRQTPSAWRSVLQRGVDSAAEFTDVVAERLHAASDPRAKLLRKRRWALRLGLFFTVTTLFWLVVTAVLASWSTPFWVFIITGAIAAGAMFPATLLLLRYRWLRAEPLPPVRTRSSRRLPPWNSAARAPMAALVSAERGLTSLLGVLERGRMLPASELRELRVAAEQSAATMAATAAEVVSMERAMASSPQARAHLQPTVASFVAQMDQGVRQYHEMVSAAAQLVSTVNSGPMSSSPMYGRRYRDELVDATDRLQGWAQAFDELGATAPGRYRTA